VDLVELLHLAELAEGDLTLLADPVRLLRQIADLAAEVVEPHHPIITITPDLAVEVVVMLRPSLAVRLLHTRIRLVRVELVELVELVGMQVEQVLPELLS
jgi:hypothetical protein